MTVEAQVPILNALGVQERYKTGQRAGELKTKKGKVKVQIKGLGLVPQEDWRLPPKRNKKGEIIKDGFYSTKETVLEIIAKKKTTDAGKIAALLLKFRELEKIDGTYLSGLEKHIYSTDSCIHGTINHVDTETGRTASAKPNLQNLPNTGD